MVGLCIIYLNVSSVQNLAFMHMTVRRAGLRLDWLLIDAEGYEINALNGATKILTRHSPKT
jgi:Methyltransferase FkbM domain